MADPLCTLCGQAAPELDEIGRCAACAGDEPPAASSPTQTFADASQLFSAVVDSEPDPLLGQDLGGCRLSLKVGAGGMGTVYRAEQLSLARVVAVKVIHADHTSSSNFVARLRSEARVIAGLNHPNILQVFDVGSSGTRHFIVMEFVDGPSLGDLIFQGLWQDQTRCRDILRQTLRGLGHAHSRGVVHRDIKPDNILLHEGRQVKLADFGLAKLIHADLKLTATGIVLGTPLYMSPEGAYGKPLDLRSDLYSLGATFYHALAGTPPFSGESAMGILYRQIHESLKPLRELNKAVDPGLDEILGRMLAKNPEERYSSCEEALQALDSLPRYRPAGSAPAIEEDRKPPGPEDRDSLRTQVMLKPEMEPLPSTGLTLAVPVQRRRRRGRILLSGLFLGALALAFTSQGRALLGAIGPGFLRMIRASSNLEIPSSPTVPTTPVAAAAGTAAPTQVSQDPATAAPGAQLPSAALSATPVPLAATPAPEATVAPAALARELLAQFAEASEPEAQQRLGASIEELAATASAEEAEQIRQSLVYLRFVKTREAVRQHLARGQAAEARAALESFRSANPGASANPEIERLFAALSKNVEEAEPQASEEAELASACESFCQLLLREQWVEMAYAFPAKRCRFPSKPNAKKVARSVAKILQIPPDTKLLGYRIEAVRAAPDSTRGWAKVALRLEGEEQEQVRSVLWAKNCGKWRLDAEPIDRGILGNF